ncbi:MAG: peptidylprolyl isomerase [Rickettsiales bacterium]|jgi:parvulin-like peptidyl-prolyl isomerase|nr:peptidylprolyl isomerase [Rickettsiales bacterium]
MGRDERRLLMGTALGFLLIVALFTITLVCDHQRRYHRVGRGKLVARVNGIRIYERDLEEFKDLARDSYGPEPGQGEMDERTLRAAVLEAYVDRVIYRVAEKYGIAAEEEIKFLTRRYQERLVREKFLSRNIVGSIGEEDLKARYQQLVDMFSDGEERKVSHIVVATEEEADRIRNLILRFNNFETIAEKKSLDRESAANGGSLGYVLKDSLAIPEFAEVAFLLKVGELSRPVRTKNGWHIIRVDDARKIKVKTYEESRNDIFEQLKQEKLEEFVDSFAHQPNIELLPQQVGEKSDSGKSDSTTEETNEDGVSLGDGGDSSGETGGEEQDRQGRGNGE